MREECGRGKRKRKVVVIVMMNMRDPYDGTSPVFSFAFEPLVKFVIRMVARRFGSPMTSIWCDGGPARY